MKLITGPHNVYVPVITVNNGEQMHNLMRYHSPVQWYNWVIKIWKHSVCLENYEGFCRCVTYVVFSVFQLKEGNMKADLEASLPVGQEDFAIRCRDVCRSYGKLKVLSNLNLTVPQGQMWVKIHTSVMCKVCSCPQLHTLYFTLHTLIGYSSLNLLAPLKVTE